MIVSWSYFIPAVEFVVTPPPSPTNELTPSRRSRLQLLFTANCWIRMLVRGRTLDDEANNSLQHLADGNSPGSTGIEEGTRRSRQRIVRFASPKKSRRGRACFKPAIVCMARPLGALKPMRIRRPSSLSALQASLLNGPQSSGINLDLSNPQYLVLHGKRTTM